MAESFVSYEVDNDRRFKNAIKEASKVSTDLRIPFSLILADFYKSQQSIFTLKGAGKYPPLSTKPFRPYFEKDKKLNKLYEGGYAEYKKAKYGFDYPLLVATGRLASSLLGPNNPGSISKVTQLSLTIGTSVKYGIYHQSDQPRSKIPLRKFLFIGPEASRFATSEQAGRLQRWTGIMQDHIDSRMRRAGLKK